MWKRATRLSLNLSKKTVNNNCYYKNVAPVKRNLNVFSRKCCQATASATVPVNADKTIASIYSEVSIPDVSFTQYLFDAQEPHAHRTVLVNGETGEKLTHDELRVRAHTLASALSRLGISQGDIVALISPNCPEYIVCYLSVIIIGATITTFNNSFNTNEIRTQLEISDSIAVIAHRQKLQEVIEASKNNQKVRLIISIDSKDEDGVVSYNKLLKDDGKGIPNIQIKPDDLLTLPFSSGTTGLPKGVMLTHKNLVSNISQILHPEVRLTAPATDQFQERCLGLLPLYHIYGMVAIMFYSVISGSQLVTMQEFEQKSFLDLIQKYKISALHLVPPLMSFLNHCPEATPDALKSVRVVCSGAAPLGTTVLDNFFEKFGKSKILIEGYGMTETSPVTNMTRKSHYLVGSCGPVVPNTLTKIVDIETNKLLGPGEGDGEVCFKGPQVMKGYYNNEKATNETIRDGWLHTGDIAYMDHYGNMFIVDRLKELIKVKGLQVAPAELENLLRLHEGVEDVAVIGIPDERAGELPKAYIVPVKGSNISEEEIKNFVASRVAEHKQLHQVSFIKIIPKSAAGKILRKDLRKLNS